MMHLVDAPPPAPEAAVPLPAPPTDAPPRRRRRRPRRRVLMGAALLLVAIAAALFFIRPFGLGDDTADGPQLRGPDSAPFRMDYPRSWKPLTAAEMATLPGQPIAVVRRRDGRGTLVITERAPITVPLTELPEGLKRTLQRRFPDFREVGAKVINLRGGARALIYSFARTKTGTAQSLVIVPSGRHSFTLNAVVPPRSPDVAREVGAMFASFQPNGDR